MKLHFVNKKAEVSACGKVRVFFLQAFQPAVLTIIPSKTTCENCKKTSIYKIALTHELADRKRNPVRKEIKVAVEKLKEGDRFTLGDEFYYVTEDAYTTSIEEETTLVRFNAADLIAAQAIGYRQLWHARTGTKVKITRGE
jgi:hypothetical protein